LDDPRDPHPPPTAIYAGRGCCHWLDPLLGLPIRPAPDSGAEVESTNT
jgi:hypothetical protein